MLEAEVSLNTYTEKTKTNILLFKQFLQDKLTLK